jgi:hypothetical protein
MSLARIVEILEKLDPVSIAPDAQASTNAYADIGLIDSEGKTRIAYTIYNAHAANVINWKVLASIDGVTFVEVEAEADLNGVTASSWVADATEATYRYFKVQIKSKVAGSHANVTVRGYAKM